MNIGLTLAAALESLYLSGRRMFSHVCECLVPPGLHKAPSCQAMHILSKKLDLLAHCNDSSVQVMRSAGRIHTHRTRHTKQHAYEAGHLLSFLDTDQPKTIGR